MERKLTAILAADVVGYSRLMEADEAGTLTRLKALLKDLLEPKVAEHHGRVVKTTGDGVLVGVEVERANALRNADLPDDRRIEFRIGINLGDVIAEGGDIYGDGVNVAARLEGMAEPGGICISAAVLNQVKNKVELRVEDLGRHRVKNIVEPLSVYRVLIDAGTAGAVRSRQHGRKSRPWLAVGALAVLLIAVGTGTGWYFYGKPPAGSPQTAPSPEAAVGLPVILVLPFQNLTDDPKQDKLGGGITEDLRDLIWNFPEFQVVSGTSSLATGNGAASLTDTARRFGARFVIEGTVRKTGGNAVITAQLIDGTTDVHLWSTRIEQPITDPVALEDAAAQKLSDALGGMTGTLRQSYERIAWSKPEADLTEYDYYVRGHTHHHRFKKEEVELARDIYSAGIKRYPNSALLRIKISMTHLMAMYRWSGDPAADAAQFRKLVTEAAALMASGRKSRFEEFYLHWISAYAAEYDRDYGRCLSEAKAAAALNPYDPMPLGDLASVLAECGNPDEGVAQAKDAIRREPAGPPYRPDMYVSALAWASYLADRCPDAIAIIRDLKDSWLREVLAACYVRLGQTDQARSTMADFVKDNPGWTLNGEQTFPMQIADALRQRWFEDIRAAGLPEK
jgi:adenylate cyclase